MSRIGPGLLCLIGVREGDDASAVEWLARRILGIRLWSNRETGKAWDYSVVQQASLGAGAGKQRGRAATALLVACGRGSSAQIKPARRASPSCAPLGPTTQGYEVLCVSQFTLYGRLKGKAGGLLPKGRKEGAWPPLHRSPTMRATRPPSSRRANAPRHCCSAVHGSGRHGQLLALPPHTPLPPPLGNKPDYSKAMPPAAARELYAAFVERLRTDYVADRVKDGVFGAEG